jgi:hypothetical protein
MALTQRVSLATNDDRSRSVVAVGSAGMQQLIGA